MDCATVRETLEAYVAGELDEDASAALAEHLAGCEACAREHAELRSFIAELHEAGEALQPLAVMSRPVAAARPARSWIRCHAWALAAALLLLLAAAAVAAATVPGVATSVGLPVGDEIHKLRAQVASAERAAIEERRQYTALQAHMLAWGEGEKLVSATPMEKLVAGNPQISRLVSDYFEAMAQARAPGVSGADTRASLERFFLPGSRALAIAFYTARGLQRLGSFADDRGAHDAVLGSLAVINSLRFDARGTHATVVVYPAIAWEVWIDGAGRVNLTDDNGGMLPGSLSDWSAPVGGANGIPGGMPHRLSLAKTASGRWVITEDFSLGVAGAQLRAGGAPKWLWEGYDRQVRAYTSRHYPVPGGALATIRRLCELLNERRFGATGALFLDHRGFRAGDFQHPYAFTRLTLVSASARPPLRPEYVADPRDLFLDVNIKAPADLFMAGGAGFPGFWVMRKTPDGHWLILATFTGG